MPEFNRSSSSQGKDTERHVASNATKYSEEELAFLKAMEQYMKQNRKRFPTFTEVLGVAKSLGYRKV